MTQITRLYDMDWSSLSHEEHWENIRVKVTGKWAGTKKGAPGTLYPRGSGWKEAATYSPALHCSTIGASGLNFSVRNGKRWDPTAITTWCLVFSSQVCFSWRVDCWLVDKLSVLLIVYCFCFIKQLVYSSTVYLLTINYQPVYSSTVYLLTD